MACLVELGDQRGRCRLGQGESHFHLGLVLHLAQRAACGHRTGVGCSATRERPRLRALAREQDSSVAVRERTKGLAAMTGAAVALSAFALSQPNPAKIKPEGLLAFAVVVLTATLLVTALWRKRLFANQFSRRMTALMVLSSLLLLASRSFGVWMRMPAPLIFTQDLLVFSAIAGVSSVLLLPWLAPLALLMLCLLYTSPSPRDRTRSRLPSSA